jgi:hypothetical protein
VIPTSPEMDAIKAQITAVVQRHSEGFFDDPKESEDLQITVRIACEFYDFLKQSADEPELNEVEYIAGTIRSGLDWFFSMAQTGRVAGLKLRSGFGSQLPRSLSELRTSYESAFHQALESTDSTKALGLLLSLVQMMLLFMTAYYPSM